MKVRRAVNAPMCPVDGEQTTWVNLADTGDDTWSCPACGRFGWVVPVGYLERHPEENPVQVIGIHPGKRRRGVAAPAARVPVARTPAPQTGPGDGASASATHPPSVAAMTTASSDVAEDIPADADPGPAAGLDGVALRDTPDTHGEPPGRTARRANQRGRRRLRMLAAGAGILTLGIGLAFASAPRGDNHHAALPPVPSNTPDTMPSYSQATPTMAAPASPTATPSGTSPGPTEATLTMAALASPTATPSRTSLGLPRAALAIKRPTIPIKQPANTALPAPPAPLPTPSPTARILRMGDQGQDEDQNGQ